MTKMKNIAVALSAIVLFAGNSFAGTVNNNAVPVIAADEPNAEPLSISFMGEDENYLYFQVAVKKGNNKTVTLEVNDENEGELYSTVYSSDKVQTLKVEKRYNQQIAFNVKAGKKTYSKSFTVVPTVVLEKL